MQALLERESSDEGKDTCVKRWSGSESLTYLVLNSLCASSINHALNDLASSFGDIFENVIERSAHLWLHYEFLAISFQPTASSPIRLFKRNQC